MQSLGLISGGTYGSRLLQSTSETITNQRSGGDIPTVYLAQVDIYGQIVGSDFSSRIRVTVTQ